LDSNGFAALHDLPGGSVELTLWPEPRDYEQIKAPVAPDHGLGDVVKALKQVKFSAYKTQLDSYLNEHIDDLIRLTQAFRYRLEAWSPQSLPPWPPGREAAVRALAFGGRLIEQLQALKAKAVEMIPKALIEMDQRLGALLAGDIRGATQVTHSITTGQAAPEVARLEHQPGQPTLRNPEPPEPGSLSLEHRTL
jgi:hypothetical protein